MKNVRRSLYAAVVALLCLAPGALAQRTSFAPSQAMLVTRPTTAVLFPLFDDKKKKKRATAPEGGAAVLYLALAASCCFGAMFVRSRQRAQGGI